MFKTLPVLAILGLSVPAGGHHQGATDWHTSLASAGGPITVRAIAPVLDGETVFAYSRISPDGRYLAYTGESRFGDGRPIHTVRIVDTSTGVVEFETDGIDAYWSPDGTRLIYLDQASSPPSVSILSWPSRRIIRDVVSLALGDYFSWGRRENRDVIATVKANYFYLERDLAVHPTGRVSNCDATRGTGERPLLSKDGRMVTVFVGGLLVVRKTDACDGMIFTGVQGAKADFSFDGTQVAFHKAKPSGRGYEIAVIDLVARAIGTLPLPGSAYYPSWTRDNELSFRYESDEWNGFVVTSNLQALPRGTAIGQPTPPVREVRWQDLFVGDPRRGLNIAVMWAPWNVHSQEALIEAVEARAQWQKTGTRVNVYECAVPHEDTTALRQRWGLDIEPLAGRPGAFADSWFDAQAPTILLFRDDVLIARYLGAPHAQELVSLLAAAGG